MAEEPKVRQDINQADVATGNVEGNQYIYSSRPFPLGIPFQAPPLPSHFVDRPEVSQDLKQRLLADSTTHSGTLVISAIQGLGGIGKTILAQALAHDSQVQERFCDGILWATLGQQPDILSLLQGWIVALKDYDYKPTTVKAASSHLNSLLYDKAVLLVIDDGWNVEDIEPFRVGSGNCQVIITTRLVDVAKKYDAQSCQLKLMSEEQSLALLVKRLGRELDDTEQKLAKQLAEAVEYLPLALDLVAARIAEGETWQELYSALTAEINRLKALEAEDDEFIVVKSESKKESVEACFNVSLNFLQNKYSSKIWSSLVWLGVLPEDVNIAAPMVATLWEVEVTKAAKILKILWNNALLLPGVPVRIGTEEWATYRIHDLLHDLAIRWLTTKDSPGLGLTIPQAHNILLERYQNNLDDENWHKLDDDDYICDHLTWHMEKAGAVDAIHQLLREETESGKNGWHSKCESLGKTAIFVGDVARAWKLAEAEYEINPSRAIGLQFRYALITSSLNTIAANIPSELISALVEKKVWSPAQGLAYARQVQSLPQRVEALSELASYFPEIWSEALETLSNIGSEYCQANVLSSLASQLPESLMPQALEAAQNLSSERYQANVLSSLVSQLPESLLPQALEVARNLEDEYSRANVLSSLTTQLPGIFSETLEASRNIEDESLRASVLSSLAPQLPEIFSEALEISQNKDCELSLTVVLRLLSSQLPENLLLKAVDAARCIENESFRAEALTYLAPRVPEIFFEALEVACSIRNEEFRAYALVDLLATQLPESLLAQALEAARNLEDEYYRAYVLSSLVSQMPEIWTEALEAARNIKDEYSRAEILSFLAPQLPKIWLEVLEAAKNLKDKELQVELLSFLAPQLSENLLPQTLQIAGIIRDEYERAYVLSSIAFQFPEIWTKALEAARNIKDEDERTYILGYIAFQFPEIWTEALEAARNIKDEYSRAKALSSIASQFPEILTEALETAKNIRDEDSRAGALNSLASQLPKNLLFQALQTVQNIGDKILRARSLSVLAPQMPEIWTEALEAARDIGAETARTQLLRALAPQMPEIWTEALEAARNITDESFRARELTSLAPQMPENLLSQALEIARNIGDEHYRAEVLCSLAPQMPEIWTEALEAARNITDEYYRARELTSLAPQLPENLLSQALEIARNIRDESYRASALSALIPNVNKIFDSFPYDFWCEVIHSLASLRRSELLIEIGEHSNIILELGSSATIREIADAIRDVGRWFP